MLKLLFKISLVIALATLGSIGIDYLYRSANNLSYQFPKNILAYQETKDKYQLVSLGNSHSESGLIFDRYNTKTLSLASVSQSFEYDLALLKMNSKRIEDNAVIVIIVSPISFSQKKPEKNSDVNMNYYDGRLSPFLIPHIKPAEYIQIQLVPFTRSLYLWRQSLAKNKNNEAMKAFAKNWEKPIPKKQELPKINSNTVFDASRSGIAVFEVKKIKDEISNPPPAPSKLLEDSMRFMVNKWYKSGGFDTNSFNSNRYDLEELIDYCLKHKWQPVLVTLPISQILIDNLEPNYIKKYVYDNLEKTNTQNIKHYNYLSNPKLTNNKYLFNNSDHLNPRGASILSYLLLKDLIKDGYLPKKVDKYNY